MPGKDSFPLTSLCLLPDSFQHALWVCAFRNLYVTGNDKLVGRNALIFTEARGYARDLHARHIGLGLKGHTVPHTALAAERDTVESKNIAMWGKTPKIKRGHYPD